MPPVHACVGGRNPMPAQHALLAARRPRASRTSSRHGPSWCVSVRSVLSDAYACWLTWWHCGPGFLSALRLHPRLDCARQRRALRLLPRNTQRIRPRLDCARQRRAPLCAADRPRRRAAPPGHGHPCPRRLSTCASCLRRAAR